jgi:NADH dehydrogenase
VSAVTGAFGFTGEYITHRLLAAGERVITLTNHPNGEHPLAGRIEVAPMDFDDPKRLAASMAGVSTLYNTYWIRFARGDTTFDRAVHNTRVLLKAAEDAGVQKIAHISITNASPDSPLPYFRAKGLVEEAIANSRLSHAIIRPTLVFGREDVLVNNIAWALRRTPVFPVFGSGEYRVQPVFVGDVAEIAVNAAQEDVNQVIDAVGPETYSYEEVVRLIASNVGSRARLVHMTPALALALSRLLGYVVRDVVLTRDEIDGLMAGLLAVETPPAGKTRFSEWLAENAANLGRAYTSELRRHYR